MREYRAPLYGRSGLTLQLHQFRPHETALMTEGLLVMATEAGAGESTTGVLTAIAAGRTKHSEIKDAIGAGPTRTLDRLVEMRIIERLLPVTEEGTRSRRRIYRITDNYLAFYLSPLTGP